LDRFIYWLALGAIAVSRHLPLAVCFVFGQCVGALLWAILPRYRKLARENLSAAFGNEMSPREICRMTFLHFVPLGANGTCAFMTATCRRKPSSESPRS
jgi:lauroyl/myristoyl acyltransferase